VIGLAAFIALSRFKLDVMLVLAACGVAGLIWQFSKPMLGR
jgi:hypothetical protein